MRAGALDDNAVSERLPALLGGQPWFPEPLHVGRPNLGDRQRFLERVEGILDRRWLSNDGPLVQEFEQRLAHCLDVPHVVAVSNATLGLQLATAALGLEGEVIVPAYTFVATAHALRWQGIEPVFADIDPRSHNIDPAWLEGLIGPRTRAIVGVHLWGQGCDTAAIEAVARRAGLPVIYDAAHALGCSLGGRSIGGFGHCEVFSFHATKFVNAFEGGAVTTTDPDLAARLRLMRNFGFAGMDRVVELGTNAKMSEVCAAMALTGLESMQAFIAHNRANYEAYREALDGLPGLSLIAYDPAERNNLQYVVLEVDPARSPLNRDALMAVLHAENVLARRYFWPGVHRMEPYRSRGQIPLLPQTERVASRVLVLPTGQTVTPEMARQIAGLLRQALEHAGAIGNVLGKSSEADARAR